MRLYSDINAHSRMETSVQQPGLSSAPPEWAGGAQAGPRTFNMHDRQIFVTSDDVELYTLCRKWVQNLPEDEAAPPEPASLQLLPLPPQANTQTEQPTAPQYIDNYSQQHYEPEEALRRLKTHWITVRQYWQEHDVNKMQRQQQRVVPWLLSATSRTLEPPPPSLPSSSLVPGVPPTS